LSRNTCSRRDTGAAASAPGAVGEEHPQPGDQALEGARDRRGRGLPPQVVDQDLDRDDVAHPEHERGEQRVLLGAADLHDPAVDGHVDRAEHPEPDAVSQRTLPARLGRSVPAQASRKHRPDAGRGT